MRFVVSLLAVCLALAAQTERQGRWVPSKPSIKGSLPKRDAEALRLKGAALADLLRSAAGPSNEYDGIAAVRFSAEPGAAGPLRNAVTGTVEVTLKPLAKGDPKTLLFRVNSLDTLVTRPYLSDDAGDMFIEPEVLETVGGFPLYRPAIQASSVLVITRPNRPLFVPVSRERLIRARHAEAVRLLEQLAAAGDAASAAAAQAKQRAGALADELSSTPAEELKTPAEIGPSDRPSGLCPHGTPGARRVVAVHPALLDPSLPAGKIRVLTLEHSDAFGFRPELESARRRVDLAAALKLME